MLNVLFAHTYSYPVPPKPFFVFAVVALSLFVLLLHLCSDCGLCLVKSVVQASYYLH